MSPRNWTDSEITDAIHATGSNGLHEHPDCIRMAGEWLDAQPRASRPNSGRIHPIKHLVENWCQRYVSADDVTVAAYLLGIAGRYPCFAIRLAHLVRPSPKRLEGISQAFAHPNYDSLYATSYCRAETEGKTL